MFPKRPIVRWLIFGVLCLLLCVALLREQVGFLSQLFADQGDTSKNGTSPPREDAEGQALVHQAIVALETQESIAAKIHYYFDLFGDLSIQGTGTYIAQMTQSGQLFRWEMTLRVPDTSGSEEPSLVWQEIFDGQKFWTYQAQERQKLNQVDVLQVAQYLKKQGNLPKIGEVGSWPGLGGLARLLRSLQADFQFVLLEKTSFRTSDGHQTRSLPAWKLLGTWKPQRLAELLPEQAERIQQGLPVQWENVPAQIPDHVILFLGQEDRFPYEIHYRRRPAGWLWSWLADWTWLKRKDHTLATIEFPEVNFNIPIPPETFTYQPPPNLKPSEATPDFLKKLQKKM